MKKEINEIKTYFSEHKKQILIILCIAILTYMIKIFNYDISIDSEVTVNDTTANDMPWICTGRWALVILGKFIHYNNKYNPFFSNLIMVIFFTLSIVILSYLISKVINNKELDNKIILMLGSLILTSPVICEMMNFTMMAAEVAVGITLVMLSVYMTYLAIYEKQKLCYILSIILLSFSMGIYQAFFPLYISIIALIYLLKMINMNNKLTTLENIKIIIKIVFIFITSYIICNVITKILLSYYGMKASGYLTNQITWGKIPIADSVANIFNNIYSIVLPPFSSSVWNYSYLFVAIISFIYIIYLIIIDKFKSLLSILCLLFILISPFFIIILTGNGVAVRTMMNLPFIVGILSILFVSISKNNVSKTIMIIFIVVTSILQLKSSLDLFYSDYIRYEEDKMLVQNIFNKIDTLDKLPKNNREEITVVFIGMHSAKSTGVIAKGDTMSYSFFEWDPATELASNQRIYGLARTLGYNYKLPTAKQVKKAQVKNKQLNVYPSNNSIKVIDDFVVVRMS